MTWLRIDWNGHGFDAMVTDASLARVRVTTRQSREAAGVLSTRLDETFHGICTLQLTGAEPQEAARYRRALNSFLRAQIKSKTAQLVLISSELQGVQALYDKQLVPLTRLTTLQRQAAQLDGERSQLTSAIAATRSKISQARVRRPLATCP